MAQKAARVACCVAAECRRPLADSPLPPGARFPARPQVFPEVLSNIVELMVDPFGNYLVQKLLDRCSEQQRLEVRRELGTHAARVHLPACGQGAFSPRNRASNCASIPRADCGADHAPTPVTALERLLLTSVCVACCACACNGPTSERHLLRRHLPPACHAYHAPQHPSSLQLPHLNRSWFAALVKQVLKKVAERGELVGVALNTHGTRAVQKLIETLSSREQRAIAIEALRGGVVSLIKDLNGNHVVQRCLQRLGPEDSQFIYDAAVAHCVEVATHRHGCCVLQRCIDFATPGQKSALVAEVAKHALVLSQVRGRGWEMGSPLGSAGRAGIELGTFGRRCGGGVAGSAGMWDCRGELEAGGRLRWRGRQGLG